MLCRSYKQLGCEIVVCNSKLVQLYYFALTRQHTYASKLFRQLAKKSQVCTIALYTTMTLPATKELANKHTSQHTTLADLSNAVRNKDQATNIKQKRRTRRFEVYSKCYNRQEHRRTIDKNSRAGRGGRRKRKL